MKIALAGTPFATTTGSAPLTTSGGSTGNNETDIGKGMSYRYIVLIDSCIAV